MVALAAKAGRAPRAPLPKRLRPFLFATAVAGALERREPWGVWGGELFLQGVVIPRKRPRGRPRKNEVAA